MSRKCPFCRKEIELKGTDCPYCHRVIIEKIYESSPMEHKDSGNVNSNRTEAENSAKSFKTKFTDPPNPTKRSKPSQENDYVYEYDGWKKQRKRQWKNHKKISFLLVGLLAVVVAAFFYFDYLEKHKVYNSLPNGTMLSSEPLYLEGLGELKIGNGTDLDAVFKLVNNYLGRSIYTVYIKAKSTHKITEISDGVYDLYFAHGRDWDEESQEFSVDNSYSKFEDNLDFATEYEYQSDGVKRIYDIFEITLHPVPGGSAETYTVSENEFGQF